MYATHATRAIEWLLSYAKLFELYAGLFKSWMVITRQSVRWWVLKMPLELHLPTVIYKFKFGGEAGGHNGMGDSIANSPWSEKWYPVQVKVNPSTGSTRVPQMSIMNYFSFLAQVDVCFQRREIEIVTHRPLPVGIIGYMYVTSPLMPPWIANGSVRGLYM